MTIDRLEFGGDSHESSAHWFGMTRSDDASNSNFSARWVDAICFYIIEQVFVNVKRKKKGLLENPLYGKNAKKSSGHQRLLLFSPESAIMATGILKRKRNLYAQAGV